MDRQKAKILFDLLRSPSSDRIIKGLREIKKRLLTNNENIGIFSNFGLAKQCLKLVQRPNEEILNGTFSILSIVCTDQSIRVEIYGNNGVLHLYNVLKGTKSETLQYRIVRTIANQSQHKISCDNFFKLGCVELIITLLQNCKEDETKCASIRALRLLAYSGEHCRKIVNERGIFHICNSTTGSSNNLVMQEVFKALAHFSRIPHPTCLKQIMEGTDNMTILKMIDNGDVALQEQVLRTILNIVRACSDLKKHSNFQLTSKLMDNLAMAQAPSMIVTELMNRKVLDISEEKLIHALCEFCEGFGPSSNFNYPPLFVGRTWIQVLDCGGATLFVSLLTKQHSDASIRTALLRALTGIEYVFGHKEKILKHFLAANIMPMLAEQFDEVMTEYRNVKRKSQEGYCVHTAPADLLPDDTASSSKGEDEKVCDEEQTILVPDNENKFMDTEEEKPKIDDIKAFDHEANSNWEGSSSEKNLPQSKTTSVTSLDECSFSAVTLGGKLLTNIEAGISGKPMSPGVSLPCLQNSGSVSCSPHSHQSGLESDQNSPTWSPVQSRCDSPPSSPPGNNFVSISGQCPWESPPSSHQSSPCSSPSYFPPWLSPPRSTSPIRAPSDWEYDEDDVDESCENGRFSPVIPKAKDLEETEDEIDDVDEGETTNTEDVNTEDETISGEEESVEGQEGAIESHIKKMLVISSTSQKRSRDSCSPCCSNYTAADSLEKKLKTNIEIKEAILSDDSPMISTHCAIDKVKSEQETDKSEQETDKSSPSKEDKEAPLDEIQLGLLKTPFIQMNDIKFRVRKRPRRKLSMDPDSNTSQDVPIQSPKVQLNRSVSICSESAYSDLTSDEYKWLQLLELLVRVIGQIAAIKEAINAVCREFVPRIMTYLSAAQVIHKSATQMLRTIAKNSLSIPHLLDSLFIPYVAVELGEAVNPENPSECNQCRILLEGSVGFLNEMENFFNHIHNFGRTEVCNRLNPSNNHGVREGCVMALPHVTRCPKLLYDFMVSYPAMDLLMQVLHSDRPPSEASYMYATAAISRLAVTLQLGKQIQPAKCPACSERRTHSQDDIARHIHVQQEQSKAQEEVFAKAALRLSESDDSKQCKFISDEVKDVTFSLEGGETLSANREFLSEKNDVLNGMLMGSFAEGSSACIKLPEIKKAALEMLIHYLYGCQCDFMENADFQSYLQLVSLSQMYMVKNLDTFAVMKMISTISEGSDIIMLYESGLGRIDENIVMQAISTTLIRPMKTWKRAQWFKELFQSKHSADIDHNIRVVLHYPLDINRLVCNCNQSLSLYAVNESVYSKLS
ncbi:uncharacterized protein [Palaemon carinicauda]|uniref:uncharacterized protein n=1 Tax=Palaemon carinicauda TaxID=392227 RepID=UPI0035B5D2D8